MHKNNNQHSVLCKCNGTGEVEVVRYSGTVTHRYQSNVKVPCLGMNTDMQKIEKQVLKNLQLINKSDDWDL